MRLLTAALLVAMYTGVAVADSPEKFSQVRIFATSESDFRRIIEAGLFIDHANTKLGHYSDAWLSESEIAMLRKSGVPYEILVDDWHVYYDSLPKMTQSEREAAIQESARQFNVSHSIYGSMGGYLTYAEVVAKLDSMRLEYPDFISQKFSIGTTIEGRTIWGVRITKNPDSPTGRPEVMYHALIHAREPESMETQMYYFYWLFENYGIDPVATYILNNREIYWISVFNVDGYVYNQTTNPNGGGNWRANRHDTGGGCGFVDLNRNYGIYQFWNSSNGGSSTNPCSGGQGTYRGPSPFSEPETQAVMNFVNSRNFNAAFGAHTYGNYLIKPWAWQDPTPTPDDNKFNQFLADMKRSNPVYTTGTPSQTVGYVVRGGSDDWYYNDSAHVGHHIFGITPETGNSFWPAQNQIIPLAQGMLFNNQYMSLIAGPYVNPLSEAFNQPTYAPGQSGSYKVVLRNKGLMVASNVQVTWTSSSPGISIPATQFTYPSLESFATDSSIFGFTISASVPNNSAISTSLTIKLDTTTIFSSPAYVLVGTGAIVLNDTGTTFTRWTTNGTWNVTTAQFRSAPSSFTDTPGGNYGDNVDNSMTLASPIDATSTPVLVLSFFHKYATEPGYDFCNVEVSSNNGTTWQPVASYDGTLSTWTQQTFDISELAGGSSQVKIRFRLTSDFSVTADGWYVDDVRINGYSTNIDTTGIVVTPQMLTLQGRPGTRLDQAITIRNFGATPVTFALTESTLTAATAPLRPYGGSLDLDPCLRKLRTQSLPAPIVPTPGNPLAFTTSLADARGDNFVYGVDLIEVLSQTRTTVLGPVLDLRVRMINPDSNVAGFLTIDADQDFGTGVWPTPWNAGPRTRDLGAEFELMVDISGRISDSLGFGYNPIAVILKTADTSFVYFPIIPTITYDSVLTVTVSGIPLGSLGLNDADQNLNIGAVFTRLSTAPFADYGPEYGHGLVGTETGVSLIRESATTISVAAGDSATFDVSVLAAKPAGLYDAALMLAASGVAPIVIPVHMTVTSSGNSHIALSATSLTDTLAQDDSSAFVLTISNTGDADLFWGMVDSAGTPWLLVLPSFGVVVPSTSTQTTLTIKSAGLTPDSTYRTTLRFISNDATNGSIAFPVTLRVDPITAVENGGRPLPTKFALHQNYPNPFNPETNISFDLPKSSFVTLRIFNIIGQEVASVVSGQLDAGTHRYVVGSEWFSSGVYFYRLQAEGFIQTRKMIITK